MHYINVTCMEGYKVMISNSVSNPMYRMSQDKNGSIIIDYDDPRCHDEECRYTINKDGSATCVSNAWGTKTELPKDTFFNDGKEHSAEEMVALFNDYYKAQNKENGLNVLA